MSDLDKYIDSRKNRDTEFSENFETGYDNFKIGVMLKQMREKSGYTQEELAGKLNTKKSSISRIGIMRKIFDYRRWKNMLDFLGLN